MFGFGSSKKEKKKVDVKEIVGTIVFKDSTSEKLSSIGFVFDREWIRKADRTLWFKQHVSDGMVHLKDKSIPYDQVKEIVFNTYSYFEEV